MIASSPIAKAAALLSASVLVVATLHVALADAPIEIAGGGQQPAAQIGTSFEDMAVGTLTPSPVDDATPQKVTPQEVTTSPTPPPTQDVTPSVQPSETASPTLPDNPLPLTPTAPALPAVTPTPTAPPAVEPSEIVASQEPLSTAPPQSVRPVRRDPVLAAKADAARPKPKVAKAKPAPKKKSAPRGNANRNNTKGAANGTSHQAKANTQGTTKKQSRQSGNAAASNYPGKVMQRISRVRKPRVNSRGTAVIGFSIASNGGLARVSVARSSGSGQLDRAAMNVIRKAAPFPAPPAGAQRQFSIRIKGR